MHRKMIVFVLVKRTGIYSSSLFKYYSFCESNQSVLNKAYSMLCIAESSEKDYCSLFIYLFIF